MTWWPSFRIRGSQGRFISVEHMDDSPLNSNMSSQDHLNHLLGNSPPLGDPRQPIPLHPSPNGQAPAQPSFEQLLHQERARREILEGENNHLRNQLVENQRELENEKQEKDLQRGLAQSLHEEKQRLCEEKQRLLDAAAAAQRSHIQSPQGRDSLGFQPQGHSTGHPLNTGNRRESARHVAYHPDTNFDPTIPPPRTNNSQSWNTSPSRNQVPNNTRISSSSGTSQTPYTQEMLFEAFKAYCNEKGISFGDSSRPSLTTANPSISNHSQAPGVGMRTNQPNAESENTPQGVIGSTIHMNPLSATTYNTVYSPFSAGNHETLKYVPYPVQQNKGWSFTPTRTREELFNMPPLVPNDPRSDNPSTSTPQQAIRPIKYNTAAANKVFDPPKIQKYIGRADLRTPMAFVREFEQAAQFCEGNDRIRGNWFVGCFDPDRFRAARTYPIHKGYDWLRCYFLSTEWSESCRENTKREVDLAEFDPNIYADHADFLITQYEKLLDCEVSVQSICDRLYEKMPTIFQNRLQMSDYATSEDFSSAVRRIQLSRRSKNSGNFPSRRSIPAKQTTASVMLLNSSKPDSGVIADESDESSEEQSSGNE